MTALFSTVAGAGDSAVLPVSQGWNGDHRRQQDGYEYERVSSQCRGRPYGTLRGWPRKRHSDRHGEQINAASANTAVALAGGRAVV
jgi:hypothetical protein